MEALTANQHHSVILRNEHSPSPMIKHKVNFKYFLCWMFDWSGGSAACLAVRHQLSTVRGRRRRGGSWRVPLSWQRCSTDSRSSRWFFHWESVTVLRHRLRAVTYGVALSNKRLNRTWGPPLKQSQGSFTSKSLHLSIWLPIEYNVTHTQTHYYAYITYPTLVHLLQIVIYNAWCLCWRCKQKNKPV